MDAADKCTTIGGHGGSDVITIFLSIFFMIICIFLNLPVSKLKYIKIGMD